MPYLLLFRLLTVTKFTYSSNPHGIQCISQLGPPPFIPLVLLLLLLGSSDIQVNYRPARVLDTWVRYDQALQFNTYPSVPLSRVLQGWVTNSESSNSSYNRPCESKSSLKVSCSLWPTEMLPQPHILVPKQKNWIREPNCNMRAAGLPMMPWTDKISGLLEKVQPRETDIGNHLSLLEYAFRGSSFPSGETHSTYWRRWVGGERYQISVCI